MVDIYRIDNQSNQWMLSSSSFSFYRNTFMDFFMMLAGVKEPIVSILKINLSFFFPIFKKFFKLVTSKASAVFLH